MPATKKSTDVTIRGGVAYTPDKPPTDNRTTTPPPKPDNQKPVETETLADQDE